MSKRGDVGARKAENSASEDERYDYVMYAANELFKFYQAEVKKYSRWYTILTTVTLIGTAMTPIIALLVKSGGALSPFWTALPSGIAGIAAAINSAFHLKDEWAQSYFTLSAIDNERDRFIVRTSPEYSIDKPLSVAIDNFQNKISSFVMSEVTLWRQAMAQSSKTHEKEALV